MSFDQFPQSRKEDGDEAQVRTYPWLDAQMDATPVPMSDVSVMAGDAYVSTKEFPALDDNEIVADAELIEENIAASFAIPDNDIRASIERDLHVRDQFARALALLDETNEIAEEKFEEIVTRAEEGKQEVEDEYAEVVAKIHADTERSIQALIQQRARKLDEVAFTRKGLLDQQDRIVESVAAAQSGNDQTTTSIKSLIQSALAAQARHERQRTEATMVINSLSNEWVEKQTQLAEDREKLERAIADREELEDVRDQLEDEEGKLKRRETKERKRLAAPMVDRIKLSGAVSDPAHPSESAQAVFDEIERQFTEQSSQEMSDVIGELKRNKAKQDRLQKRLDINKEDIESLELSIFTLSQRLREIPGLNEQAQATLQRELDVRAKKLDQWSGEALIVAETYKNINRGDTTSVARDSAPAELNAAWTAQGNLQRALERRAPSMPDEEVSPWPELNNDTPVLASLRMEGDEPHTVGDVSGHLEAKEAIQEVVEQLPRFAFGGRFKRGWRNKGLDAQYAVGAEKE